MNQDDFKERLLQHLLHVATDNGWLQGTLLASPDIDQAWLRYAPSYYGDAVREFNAYPEYALACAGYLGMAIAALWDEDWTKYENVPYSFFQGKRGFDDMDDHITGNILEDSQLSVPAMQSCSAAAYHFLLKEAPEPGTADAYRMFLAAVEDLFKIGAAIWLSHLGYKFKKVNLN